jgi:hypothetical protein
MRAVLAPLLLAALSVSAAAQEPMSVEDLLAVAKTTYPGELCWWERAEENLDEARSWTLAFRYDYEQDTGPDRQVILHQLPCFYGAYNFGSLWFTETEFEGLVPLHFAVPEVDIDYADAEETILDHMKISGFSTQAALINAEFDEKTQAIVNYSKWRGLGDASSSGTWTFRQGKFVLTHYEIDPTYNGELDPVSVFGHSAD